MLDCGKNFIYKRQSAGALQVHAALLTYNGLDPSMAKSSKTSSEENVKKCKLVWCHKKRKSLGLCDTHYKYFKKTNKEFRSIFRGDYSQNPSKPCWNAVCIPMTKGIHALVDVADYEAVSKHMWSSRYGYAHRQPYKGSAVSMHRMLMNCPEGMDIDHVNGIRSDNRRDNLRICTRSQNMMNRPKSDGYKGVSFDKKYPNGPNPYRAHIKYDNKQVHIGSFPSAFLAAKAYDAEAKKHHGKFAALNFPEE